MVHNSISEVRKVVVIRHEEDSIISDFSEAVSFLQVICPQVAVIAVVSSPLELSPWVSDFHELRAVTNLDWLEYSVSVPSDDTISAYICA